MTLSDSKALRSNGITEGQIHGFCQVTYKIEVRFLSNGNIVQSVDCPVAISSLPCFQQDIVVQTQTPCKISANPALILRCLGRRNTAIIKIPFTQAAITTNGSNCVRRSLILPISISIPQILACEKHDDKELKGPVRCIVKSSWQVWTSFFTSESCNRANSGSSESQVTGIHRTATQHTALAFPPLSRYDKWEGMLVVLWLESQR